ncbi:MAG: hypothetical protein WCO78_03705 [Candidatus Roizmanbacteria bacterium]
MNLESAAGAELNARIRNERQTDLPSPVIVYGQGVNNIHFIQGYEPVKISGGHYVYSDFANEMSRILMREGSGPPTFNRVRSLRILDSHLYFLSADESMKFYMDRIAGLECFHTGISELNVPSFASQEILKPMGEEIYKSRGPGYDTPPKTQEIVTREQLMRAKATFDMGILHLPEVSLSDFDRLLCPPDREHHGQYDWLYRFDAEKILSLDRPKMIHSVLALVSSSFRRLQGPSLSDYAMRQLNGVLSEDVSKRKKTLEAMYLFGVGAATHGILTAKYTNFGDDLNMQIDKRAQIPVPLRELPFVNGDDDDDFRINEAREDELCRSVYDSCRGMWESYEPFSYNISGHLLPEDPDSARLMFGQGMVHGIQAHEVAYPTLMRKLKATPQTGK